MTPRAICWEVNGRVSKTNTCLRAAEQRPRGTKTARFRERDRDSEAEKEREREKTLCISKTILLKDKKDDKHVRIGLLEMINNPRQKAHFRTGCASRKSYLYGINKRLMGMKNKRNREISCARLNHPEAISDYITPTQLMTQYVSGIFFQLKLRNSRRSRMRSPSGRDKTDQEANEEKETSVDNRTFTHL